MEASVGKPEVPDSSKKSRSLDLKSVYSEQPKGSIGKSRANDQQSVLKRKNEPSFASGGSGSAESRKKRSRKELSLSGFDPVIKRHRDGRSRPKPDGSVSGVGKRKNPSYLAGASHDLSGPNDNLRDSGCVLALPLPPKKEGDQTPRVANLESSDGLDVTVNIPKRPRGVSRRKRSEKSISPKRASYTSSCSGKSHADGQTSELAANLVAPSQVSIDKQNKRSDEFKENGSSRDNSDYSIKGANGTSAKVSRRKVRSRKPQVSAVETQTHKENEARLVKGDQKPFEDFLDDDEENLEENAAIMLSSRFDPRCTGFPRKRTASSKLANESSFQPFHKSFKVSGLERSSVHAEGRALRPRNNNSRGFVRKRRHFYEVCYSDMDPYWVVKQRIRVFWPLDQNWYFGLVKDYDPVSKLHYVKYDDRDEEWINLQNERFKLLLFPSEVKFNSERSRSRMKKKIGEGDTNTLDDNYIGSIMESETIISWLARSNRPVKSSPISIQKQRRIHVLEEFEASILSASKGRMSVSPPSLVSNKLSPSCIVLERLIEGEITQVPKTESRTDSGNRKLSFVYFRKRFRRRGGMIDQPECDSACASSTGPISLLASVADRESALEELYANVTPTKLKQITLKLNLPPQRVYHHAFGAENFLLCSTLLLHHGKLMHVWPKVHMEIVIVDSALGLRLLSFEGCLRWAVALVCLIMATFNQNKNQNKLLEIQVPYTSVGFKLSCLHDRQGQFLFALSSFMELESPKWRYLENKLKQQCMTTGELPIEECTYINIKNLSSKSNQILCTSIFEYPFPLEGFPKRSCSDIMRQLFLNRSAFLNMDPGLCYFDKDCGMLPPSVLPFASGPLFFLSMHLKLLMENNTASLGFQKPDSTSSQDCPENYDKLAGEGCSPIEDSSDQVSETTNENFGSAAASFGWLSFGHLNVETDALSLSNDGDWIRPSHNFLDGEINMSGNHVGLRDVGKKANDETFVSQRFLCHTKSRRGDEKSYSPFHEDSSYPDKSAAGYSSSKLFTRVEERLSERGLRAAGSASDLVWEMNERVVRSPNTTAPRSIWRRNRHSSISPKFGQCSKLWPEDFVRNGFVNASRKPRTLVSYSLHVGDCDPGSKHRSHHKKERLYKKIKTDNAKSISDVLESPNSYLESLTCYANVLVAVGDRGWRECGAKVVLDSDDQKDWRLSVKFSGTTKYVHKAHQFLQPGITNRYTHAMMWKGGKDWTLEFTDRSQWSLFKVIYEECFNRNVRAASVKNIPIPGVCLIDDGDENIVEVPFIRSSSKYHRQVGTDVDMALDPSHVLYDMDSSDEEWISNLKNSLDHKDDEMADATDDMFERVMDMFEKVAYAEQCDRFTGDEIEEFMADFGPPLDVIKAIYEHWQQKKRKKGLPLIRQFQPPLWEHYQKQLKEWELAMNKIHSSADGFQETACLLEKPPMFAFCLRPRGLEVPNRGSKQKSHRKFMFTGHHISLTREQDGLHAYGRKSNGLPLGEEKSLFAVPNHEFSYSSHWLQSPSSVSPKDAARTRVVKMTSDGSDRSRHPKLYRNNSKKNGMSLSPRDSQMLPFTYNEKSKKTGAHCWGADMCEWPSRTKPSQPDGLQSHRADINEFRLRDASNAAQHASNMAKLKREKAQWLLRKADLALHKATVALMTAEAIKASQKDLIGDG